MYKITDSYLFIQANSVFLPKPRFHARFPFRGFPRRTGPHRAVHTVHTLTQPNSLCAESRPVSSPLHRETCLS